MGRLGVVLGGGARGLELPDGEWAVRERHGGAGYLLPHELDHVANMRALADAGCDRVLAIGSCGGLRPELGPGTFVVPDDFIALDVPQRSALRGMAAHRVPGFDVEWRGEVVAALRVASVELTDGGVYWEAAGPRLETPAEIRFVAEHADVIGMTIASECVAAGELELRYAALCVVDNLANSVGEAPLTLEQIEANRQRNRDALRDVLAEMLPALTGAPGA